MTNTGTYTIPVIAYTDTLSMEPGYDDVFIYNGCIVLSDRNSGRILTYSRTGLNSFDIGQYLQIAVLDGYLYYQSASDWEVYRTDIYHSDTERVGEIPEGDIFMPMYAGNYMLLNPAMNTLTSVSGYMQKEFIFSRQISDYELLKWNSAYIGVYSGKSVVLFDYFGNEITAFNTGEIDDFCIADYGVFLVRHDTLLYADYRDVVNLMTEMTPGKMAYSDNRLILYDSGTGQALSIRFSQ